jgi:hypothetical protein
MNSNDEDPWIAMNDFEDESVTSIEKQEPEKRETEKSTKPRIEYNKALEEFYKAKKLYDDAYERTKKKYLKNRKLTTEQKKQKIKAIKRKCVFCKGEGGMIFTNTEGHYRGKCGAASPCKFNIELKRGHYMLMPDILEALQRDKDSKMANIIALKLSLLFGLKDREIVTQEFEAQKKEYRESVDSFDTIKKMLDQLDTTVLEDEGEEKTIKTSSYVSQLKQRLKEALTDFKTEINAYNNPVGEERNIVILQRALELYIRTIIPIQEKIRRATYALNVVDYDEDNNKHILIQKRHTLTQLELNIPGYEDRVINMQLR